MAFFNKQIEPGAHGTGARFWPNRSSRGWTTPRRSSGWKKRAVGFQYPVSWGLDLQTEHERYLTEQVIGGPLFVLNYPKDIKAFYMRQNDDGRTVAAMDLLVPKVGEIIGGSASAKSGWTCFRGAWTRWASTREALSWYLDSRRWGSCPHAGFGLGFERLIMHLTGMENIRDVIPFPRTPGHAEF